MVQTHKSRLTLDMDSEEHAYIKMACAMLGVTMREFMLSATFEKMEQLEDKWLAKKAEETLKRIQTGVEKTSTWKKAKERLQ
ncbi:MAG: hypothetical protein ACK5MA_08890 [Parachlamydiaceae bacterium]